MAPATRTPPVVVEDVVVEIAGVVPNFLGAITTVIPQIFAMPLPILAIRVAPVLAVFTGGIEVVPTLVAV